MFTQIPVNIIKIEKTCPICGGTFFSRRRNVITENCHDCAENMKEHITPEMIKAPRNMVDEFRELDARGII